MLELRYRTDFSLEASLHPGVVGKMGVQGLDRDLPFGRAQPLFAFVDGPHSALPQKAQHFVLTTERLP